MEPVFLHLGIAALLGLLVGLQREHVGGEPGMRTFPLVTLLGALAALLARTFGGWILAAGLLGLAAAVTFSHWLRSRDDQGRHGITTDVALLVMFAVGALLTVEHMTAVAVAVGGSTAVLLQFKPELHGLARKLGDADLRAIMQFVLITCIILPVLPNRAFNPLAAFGIPSGGALDVLNPFEIWLMVVLIVGMSLVGYIVYKFFGRDAGILLGGVLGGAVSSTATTASYARGARDSTAAAHAAAVIIAIASTVMYVRMLIAVAVVAPSFLARVVVPVVALMGLSLAPALVAWLRVRRRPVAEPADPPREQANPTQLTSAVVFAALYAIVLFALALAKQFIGVQGVYGVAALSGLTEMDALTLSTARMTLSDPTIFADGWRLLIIGSLANLVSKAAIAGILGGRRFFLDIAALFAVPMLGGLALLLLF